MASQNGGDSTHGRELTHLLLISRVIWEHVIVPFVLVNGRQWPAVPIIKWVWVLGVAEALFPLVPRACRAVMSIDAVADEEDGDMQLLFTSRYLALKCAGRAGSVKCMRWILQTKETRNNTKDCLTVIRGLCYGGHIGMAQEFIQSSGCGSWRGIPLSWPTTDPDLMDEIKDATSMITESLLWDACRGGHVEAVKWVMSTFGVGSEGWELVEPFKAAVRGGHAAVLKWLASTTDAVAACRTALQMRRKPNDAFFGTPSFEVVKLCTEWLCGGERNSWFGEEVLLSFIRYSSSGCDDSGVEEGCQWIKDSLPVRTPPNLRDCIDNLMAFKWVVKPFHVTPTKDNVYYALRRSNSMELLLWLLTFCNSNSTATLDDDGDGDGVDCTPAGMFIGACANELIDCEPVVRALWQQKTAQPLTLTTQQLHECLSYSLGHAHIDIADWLENTFHVMGGVNADPDMTREILSNTNSFQGVQWFVSKATAVRNFSASEVHEALANKLQCSCCRTSLFLLGIFNIPIPPHLRPVAVEQVISIGNLSQAKQLLTSHGMFSSEDVAEGLLANKYGVQSGKVVKWLINEFNLNGKQVRANDNRLLRDLLWAGKTNRAEWLIHKFNVTLEEITSVVEQLPWNSPEHTLSLRTWKMILRVFPNIDVKEHLMQIAMSSPLHIQATIKAVKSHNGRRGT
ncbi:hypothetical protein Pelo_7360 [Pelomyxa schiedti]|nr:hypothetical protein Pelo_7360 [Pelomyxa schiedti]